MELIQAGITWVASVLTGPFGGVVGGAVTFVILDWGARNLKQRRDLADALAAELADNADAIQGILNEGDRGSIPLYYRTSETVFKALVGQLGVLPHEEVAQLAKLYRFLESTNRLPDVWQRRLEVALDLPMHHPHREAELPSLREAADDFYEHLEGLLVDCHNLASGLRTRHGLTWRRAIPRRFRPTSKVVRRELPKPDRSNPR